MSLREELPYRVEYAKSGRASCKSCKDPIAKDSVRLAVMVQSPFFDGMQPNWHHFQCFFQRWRPRPEEIAHFASLKYDDQKRIQKACDDASGVIADTGKANGKKSRKKKADTDGGSAPALTNGTQLAEFKVEYAKSNRSKCRLCENTCVKDTVRISRLDRESADAKRYGPLDRWFHVECFASARESLKYFASGDKLPFFDKLAEEDRKEIKKKIPAIDPPLAAAADAIDSANGSPAKKPKISNADEKKLKKQSDLLFKYQENVKTMKKQDLIDLMEANKIEIPEGMPSKYERVSDAMAFGALAKCPECKKGQLVFRISGYICTGNVSQWAKCEYETTDKPKRKPFKVPKELAEEYAFLAKYKYEPRDRIYNAVLKHAIENPKPSTSGITDGVFAKKEDTNGGGSSGPVLALSGYNIGLVGKVKTSKAKLKPRLKTLGATLVDRIDRTTLCIISTKAAVDKESEQITDAKDLSVPIVSEEFLVAVEKDSNPIQAISLNRLDDFEVDVEKRFANLNVKEKMKTAFKSGAGSGRFEKSGGKQKMVLKEGNVVDPECEVADVTHIYKQGSDVYSVVLSAVDLSKNRNSFYKLQLLEHDTKKTKYFVFKAWGRVGTTIGGTTLEKFSTVSDAIDYFTEHYVDKTGNEWSARHHFQKVPDKYFPVDIDFGGDQTDSMAKLEVGKRSKLALSVQDFICSIFDVQKMKEQMLEFELDMEKMPLGKLSKKQLLSACSVLKKLSKLVVKTPPNTSQLKSATNEFYTLIPHNFGTERPPLIDTEAAIKTKMDMLDALLDIEMAYDMITSENKPDAEDLDPIDQHYRKLKTTIEPLSKEEEEFEIIEKYLKNTHGSTHHFSLDIVDAFKVEREGESERFQKHKDSDNRLLLWHGSRVTNFAGILSQGLRIAPPEAPVTGYMFGKGIYFADMVTKSAGYCHYQSNKNVGYLLLSEVAIGETWDLMDAKDVTSLPKGKHSVKGVGQTQPDPKTYHVMPNGTRVPFGTAVKSDQKCSLLYNEFIVYDINQVNVKYLLKCQFKSKMF
ncbi:unnamed protein product [Medioppia subpectinata]|uniref:Poly [ADP-ribose] polymerase n=1 Tax=Medioppia subpectinata TaxID=1979941 RepID=A0A7R9Q579_9ACAR|nr:unnamed protein product [Medioppia subpectinata]CAG2113149.1 unnamed protein product [Medioppia subpectinata]